MAEDLYWMDRGYGDLYRRIDRDYNRGGRDRVREERRNWGNSQAMSGRGCVGTAYCRCAGCRQHYQD